MPGRADNNPAAQLRGTVHESDKLEGGDVDQDRLAQRQLERDPQPVESLLERGQGFRRPRWPRRDYRQQEHHPRQNPPFAATPCCAQDRASGPRSARHSGSAVSCWSMSRSSISGSLVKILGDLRPDDRDDPFGHGLPKRAQHARRRADQQPVELSGCEADLQLGQERPCELPRLVAHRIGVVLHRRAACANRGEGASRSVRHDVPQRQVLGAGFEDRLHRRVRGAGLRAFGIPQHAGAGGVGQKIQVSRLRIERVSSISRRSVWRSLRFHLDFDQAGLGRAAP